MVKRRKKKHPRRRKRRKRRRNPQNEVPLKRQLQNARKPPLTTRTVPATTMPVTRNTVQKKLQRPQQKKGKPGKKGKKKGSDSDSDEDWGKSKKATGGAKKGGGKGKGGYTRAITLSPELAAVVGADQMARHEVVKKVWSIIKERNLYDPKNKQFAICDEELMKVIGVKRFRTFGMMKYLKNHFVD
uniref:Spp27_0 protein n=1 Tax=Fopius arisanus TaxID=64838 RepID=A0A0C9QAT4_9HYME